MKQKYYLTLDAEERRFIIESLNNLSSLIAQGGYTDTVDKVLIKTIGAKIKKYRSFDQNFEDPPVTRSL